MAKILNTLLGSLCVFFVCFLWIVYCLKDGASAAGLAAIVAVAAGYLIYNVQSEQNLRKSQKRAAQKRTEALGEYLRFGEDNAALFEKMLSYFRFEVQKEGYDDLIAVKNNVKGYVALRYASDALTKEQLALAVAEAKRKKCDKLYLFAHKADKSLLAQAEKVLPVTFADVANVYALLEQSDKLPQLNTEKPSKKASFAAKYAFSRKRFGLYLATTVFLSAITVISYVKWYTLAWATASLALALYSLLNKRYNAQPTAVTLD